MKKIMPFVIVLLSLLAVCTFAEDEMLYIKAQRTKTFDDRMEIYGAEEISKGNFFLKSDKVTIFNENGEQRRIDAEESVYVKFDTGKATAVTLDYDLQDEKGTMTGDVIALITSKTSSETIDVKCDTLDIDNNRNFFAGRMNERSDLVNLKKGGMTVSSRSFEYNERRELLTLYENVYIDDDENNRIITGDFIVINLADDSVEGRNVSIENKTETDEEGFEIKSNNFKTFEDRIEFYSYSTIKKGDFILSSPEFIVYKENGEERKVVTQQRSYVEFDTGKATSDELDYDLKTEKGLLTGNVDALLVPDEGATEVKITCDYLETDGQNKLYNGHVEDGDKVRLTRGNLYAEALEFEYDSNHSELTLKDSAYIDDLENSQRLWGSTINLNLDNDAIKGTDIRLIREQETDGKTEQVQMRSADFEMLDDRDEFKGPSEIIRKDLRLVSDRFTIHKTDGKQETIQATQGVYIEFESGNATSTEFIFDMDTSEGTLTKDVYATIEQKDSTETIFVKCDTLKINEASGNYSGNVSESEKVLINKGRMEAESKSFEYAKNDEKLILANDVYVYDPDNRRTIIGDKLTIFLDTDETEGENIQMTIITKE
ncbi:MAG TPA: LptA/OstA family protein [Thermotogota bacterium]|nr:LptA/OstA family protein [Thermotogota bacterium]HPR96753.1 LptA/OstA family protein [Thermotogota bacterium]